MPRYFFNVRDDLGLSDDEGVDLPDVDAALNMAVHYAGSLIKDSATTFRMGDTWRLEVLDEAQHSICQIDLHIRSEHARRLPQPRCYAA